MKTIDCWQDLRPYGIDILTGEACRYGMRYLCDLDEKGAKLVRELFGMPYDAPLAKNWNSKGVASVMLPYEMLPQLAAFALFADGAAVVVARNDGVVEGWYPDDEEAEGYERHLEVLRETKRLDRTYSPIGGPGIGSRMTHAMSGRTD